MVSAGYIDEETAKKTYDIPIQLNKTPTTAKKYGYFIDAVIEEAIQV
ncbi:MAG: hypothetical protein PHZ11_05475 [Desulfitobacteriaceae bacterium]|nr:hypothetical protein [Desulfitobacteriaceae bacterium]